MYFVFQNKITKKYRSGLVDVDDPKQAYPKIGDRCSAWGYADECFETCPEFKQYFKDTYTIAEINE